MTFPKAGLGNALFMQGKIKNKNPPAQADQVSVGPGRLNGVLPYDSDLFYTSR